MFSNTQWINIELVFIVMFSNTQWINIELAMEELERWFKMFPKNLSVTFVIYLTLMSQITSSIDTTGNLKFILFIVIVSS